MPNTKLRFYPELVFVFIASLIAVLSSHIVTAAGVKPCELCYYQRYIYYALILASFVAMLFKRKVLFLLLLSGLILLQLGVASFHTGVEMGVFKYESNCTVDALPAEEINDIANVLLNTDIVRCDKPQIVAYGLSMAAWNVIYSLLMFIIFIYLSYAEKRKGN